MPLVDQDQITRITRQKTRQLLSTGDGLQDTPTNTAQEDAIAALSPNQAADQTEMCNEGKKALLLSDETCFIHLHFIHLHINAYDLH